jgi:hypothetical protein
MLLAKFSLECGGYESDLDNAGVSREIGIGDHVRVVWGILSGGEGIVIMVNRNNQYAKIQLEVYIIVKNLLPKCLKSVLDLNIAILKIQKRLT